jgi:hypothetical protein
VVRSSRPWVGGALEEPEATGLQVFATSGRPSKQPANQHCHAHTIAAIVIAASDVIEALNWDANTIIAYPTGPIREV